MAQLQGMDACPNTLSDKLCQVNTRVSRFAQQQVHIDGFVASPSPSLETTEEEEDDGDSDGDDDDKDASSSGDKEMTA